MANTKREALQIYTRNTTESLLLALPRELRDTIYQHTLEGNTAHINTNNITCRNAALLAVCRQTRTEAMPIFFKNTSFSVLFTASLISFLTRISRKYWSMIPEFKCGWRLAGEAHFMWLNAIGIMDGFDETESMEWVVEKFGLKEGVLKRMVGAKWV